MSNARPVSAVEVYLHIWPVSLLIAVCIYRLLRGYMSSGNIWLSDMQILTVGLLLAGLLLGGCLLPNRQASLALSVVLGLLAWITIVSMLPRGLWSGYPHLRAAVPLWQQAGAGVLCLAGFVVRWWNSRRWLSALQGHGYAWMHHWAASQPLYARLLVQRILVNQGYSFEE